ncbi:transcription elongation factor-like protein spt6 [Pseudovirgaria hyperparasitica]|uniref:Transcription elongation factor Spt6 n=1 Tax=Pseudovirgaria hyperparasitica TaxID=470096 RepID=A0A6A6WJZ3_9PEZI|nr:transcription elongation factor-like protein spt6 [Pseudovirgaria hyperparasitica]KAF2762407.1 transcription elongation factor-like protein spt6 [Pseudovirgaria hyperparasitica]
MSRNLLDVAAELGSEEEDEDFDEEGNEGEGPRRKTNGMNSGMDDSSEEEDDDDDEEEAAKIREGFIVDEDEYDDDRAARRREKRKRRRAEREEEEAALDEEDLDLIGEANPELEQRKQAKSKFKRLKRGHRDEEAPAGPRGVDEIFSDDDDEAGDDDRRPLHDGRGIQDEFADFIEEDEFEDDVARALEEEREVARPGTKGYSGLAGIEESGLDEASLEDMRAAFGTGHEYDWALDIQDEEDFREEGGEKQLELKHVFEPSELIDRMLTDEDNEIRRKDVPERFQVARKPFKERDYTNEAGLQLLQEEAQWISNLLLPKKRLASGYVDPFKQSVRKVLDFMVVEDYEVPFIFQHRKDFLIHSAAEDGEDDRPERLLSQDDLWEIFELDLKFRGLVEKREALQATYEGLKSITGSTDVVFEDMIIEAVTMEEIQDIQEYLHFRYAGATKDLSLIQSETNGSQKRAQSAKSMFERIRSSNVYNFVRAIGITSEGFSTNMSSPAKPHSYTEDVTDHPEDLADASLELPEFSTGQQVLRAGKAMFVEEVILNPRIRKYVRINFYEQGLIDCVRTEKGLRHITEDHPYYAFKYLRAQDIAAMVRSPELYLRMLKAEREGYVEVKFRLANAKSMKERMYQNIESDNVSEVADAWNALRREVVGTALTKLEKIVAKGVKETLKAECESHLARACRERYGEKLDQAPYKPKGMMLGTTPRVLALSNGRGVPGRDAICWAWVEDNGRVQENGKFVDLRLGNPDKYIPDGKDVANLIELVKRRKPDVLAVSGFSVETKKLFKELQDIIDKFDIQGPEYENEDGHDVTDKLEVIIVNDEVARLYHNSKRSELEYPGLPPTTRYCIAIAKYLQSPVKEYASLGVDITTIPFDPNQDLVPPERLLKILESAMVDIVNLVGVNIDEAINDPYTANLLPYVCGLGPRKTIQLTKAINANGGVVISRYELLGVDDSSEKSLLPAVGAKVFANCASFLYLDYDPTEAESDYLDNTRVHPEDYDIGRKMAADALELDEEDIKQEVDDGGASAVIRRMVREKEEEKVNELVLEEYAVQLESKFHQRKRATLETIRAELQSPYEELRRNFALLNSDDIFTMLTGDTKDSLTEGMVVPVVIRRAFADHIEVKLDNGIEGAVSESEFPEGVGLDRGGADVRSVFQTNQTVQAKIVFINRKQFTVQLSLREEALRRPYKKDLERPPSEWDEAQEAQDKKNAQKAKEEVSGRAQRVVNHPLFFSYNAAQAEEYLGSKEAGEVVIRPSSKGLDHLAVTWKVADNVYQHIDVLELDKENEFSLGRTLKVGGKYTYSDLDELIVNHVESMAKKVTEMTKDERFQKGSRAQTEQWLKTYTEANPKRSMYAFCIMPKFPGYFQICFKAGQYADLGSWPIKVIPNAFELKHVQYPDMRALKNGFKLLFSAESAPRR